MSRKNKLYFSINGYGTLLIPIALLEKIKQEGVMVETEWSKSGDSVKKTKPINEVKLWNGEDIDLAEAQMILQGDE